MVAAAIVGGAVVGGVASNKAADKAADAQSGGAEAGVTEERRQFDKVIELLSPFSIAATGQKESSVFNAERYLQENPDVAASPWYSKNPLLHWQQHGQKEGRGSPFDVTQAAPGSLSAQQDLIGLNGPDAQKSAIGMLEQSPLFADLIRQGESGILQNASATGGLRGGNVQEALAQFRPQLLNQLIENQYSKLSGITQLGQSSAAGQAGAAQQTGSNVANLYGQMGAAGAGRALAQGQAFSNIGTSLGTAAIINKYGDQMAASGGGIF